LFCMDIKYNLLPQGRNSCLGVFKNMMDLGKSNRRL